MGATGFHLSVGRSTGALEVTTNRHDEFETAEMASEKVIEPTTEHTKVHKVAGVDGAATVELPVGTSLFKSVKEPLEFHARWTVDVRKLEDPPATHYNRGDNITKTTDLTSLIGRDVHYPGDVTLTSETSIYTFKNAPVTGNASFLK